MAELSSEVNALNLIKINKDNLNSWSLGLGRPESIVIDPTELSHDDLHRILMSLQDQMEGIPSDLTTLQFKHRLSDDQLTVLTQFVCESAEIQTFAVLDISLSLEDLNNPKLIELLEACNYSQIKKVSIDFIDTFADTGVSLEQNLFGDAHIAQLEQIAQKIYYPISIFPPPTNTEKEDLLKQFYGIILKNYQQKNFAQLTGKDLPKPNGADNQDQHENQNNKKIRLKELIFKTPDSQFDEYKKTQVQQIENVQFQENIELENLLENRVEIQVEQDTTYVGELIDYNEFAKTVDYESYRDFLEYLKQECFANLPNAIKYVSPSAAVMLKNYLEDFVSINKGTEPEGFITKKNKNHEWVLDYDPAAPSKKTDPFRPKIMPRELWHIHDVFPPHLFPTPTSVTTGWNAYKLDHSNLIAKDDANDIWVKYGDEGSELILNELRLLDKAHPGKGSIIYTCYLDRIENYGVSLDGNKILKCLIRIKNYDHEQAQLLCFFLRCNRRHDLSATLDGFDRFWFKWKKLAEKNHLPVSLINTDKQWWIPNAGNPVVYMERLLTLLTNARDVKEQIECIKEIQLDNYSAYYASKYEGFKVVSNEMGIEYKRENVEKKKYSKDMDIYRKSLDELYRAINHKEFNAAYDKKYREKLYWVDCDELSLTTNELNEYIKAGLAIEIKTKDEIINKKSGHLYATLNIHTINNFDLSVVRADLGSIHFEEGDILKWIYRFVGQQQVAMSIPKLNIVYEDLLYWSARGPHNNSTLFNLIFYIAHERYIENVDYNNLCVHIRHSEKRFLTVCMHIGLLRLYKKDIKLSADEGLVLHTLVMSMNDFHFESYKFDHVEVLKKIFKNLEKNKYVTYEHLSGVGKYIPPSFIFALDIADCLAEDPNVEFAYQNQLLKFSSLIISNSDAAINARKRALHNNANKMNFRGRKQKNINDVNIYEISEEVIKQEPEDNIKRVREYMAKAAKGPQPNRIDYFIRTLVSQGKSFTDELFLKVCDELSSSEIEATEFTDFQQVHEIMTRHQCFSKVTYRSEFSISLNTSHDTIRQLLLLIYRTVNKNNPQQEYAHSLNAMSSTELSDELNQVWAQSGIIVTTMAKSYVLPILQKMKGDVITAEFSVLGQNSVSKTIQKGILNAGCFNIHCQDLSDIKRLRKDAKTLAQKFKNVLDNASFSDHKKMTSVFENFKFANCEYTTIYQFVDMLENMPQRNCENILLEFVKKDPKEYLAIITLINTCHAHALLSQNIARLIEWYAAANQNAVNNLLNETVNRNHDDNLVQWLFTENKLNLELVTSISTLTKKCDAYRDVLQKLFAKLLHNNQLQSFISIIENAALSDDQKLKVILMIARSETMLSKKLEVKLDYCEIAQNMLVLDVDNLNELYAFYEGATPNTINLANALKNRNPAVKFTTFLSEFEKDPFGNRDLDIQFETSEVERVINNLTNLNQNSIYTYSYRKQLMEAFLFVNRAGFDLPLYNNKPAKDLTNEEIKNIFQAIKSKQIKLDPFQAQLYALPLMREAMYRATGQFAYSTQIIAIIDCMMHDSHVISNIDTGQGKSLIDVMKAAVLLLDSTRVDISTSSIVDAKRDIEIYAPFLKLLEIDHNNAPITASSPIDAYQVKGINYSTMAQFALFDAKVLGTGKSIGTDKDIVSLVMNESDYTILDDKTIYRLAMNCGFTKEDEWIYAAINEFAYNNAFLNKNNSETKDINLLRKHLRLTAKQLNKKLRKLNDQQLLNYIESTLMVNYCIKENFDYVVTKEPEPIIIENHAYLSRLAKVLIKDGKVSPDSEFGNGMQQLLCDKLNAKYGAQTFIIKPETKSIICLNNRVMINKYLSKNGRVWGSSATVGNSAEVKEQFLKYAFEFTQIDSHQTKQVQFTERQICPDEDSHFEAILRLLKNEKQNANMPPALVFFKDIETAERFYKYVLDKLDPSCLQCFTGLDNEAKVIEEAAKPGKITITTSALGRNTDILYEREFGMTVIQTFVDTKRKFKQRSGRTGRQGSPGWVHTILNQADFPGLTPAQFEEKNENAQKKEREFNEAFYNLIGQLMRHLKIQPAEFYNKQWADFSQQLENEYRELKLSGLYDETKYVNSAVAKFNTITELALNPAEVQLAMNKKEQEFADREAYLKPVTMSECTSPDHYAYQFIGKTPQKTAVNLATIETELDNLMTAVAQNQFKDVNKQYIHYLNSTNADLKVIRKAHVEFIQNILLKSDDQSKLKNKFKQWIGVSGPLQQKLGDPQYLILFRALLEVSPADSTDNSILEPLRNIMVNLLNEYLERSWFINARKKELTGRLITKLQSATSINDLLVALTETKKTALNGDINKNQKSLYHKIKPQNYKASRLQDTLDQAFALTNIITNKKPNADLIDSLRNNLSSVSVETINAEITETYDQYKAKTGVFHYRDRYNAAVLDKSFKLLLEPEHLKNRKKKLV